MEERLQGSGTDSSLHPGTCGLNIDGAALEPAFALNTTATFAFA